MALPERVKTKTGTVIGSGNYMAPEQALGRVNEVDGRTDIYGLGATLFHALSGRPLHAGLSDAALLIAAATQEAPSLASSGVKVPSLLISVVDRCLRKAKENRYQDVASLRRDLHLIRLAENL
jgi:serine/threonine-protein kinase